MAAATSKKRKTATVVKRYVPPELVREIILHLPCKSLARFKSVSKLFDSFLHDNRFIEEHRKLNTKPSHYLTWDTDDQTKLHVFSLSSDEYSHVKTIATEKYRLVLPSSYGLVCVHGVEIKNIALLNPVSGKLAPLPDLPRRPAYEIKNIPGATIPTAWRYNNVGFGFDLKSQMYKIVQLAMNIFDFVISQCFVLTVTNGTLSWREIDVPNKFLEVYFRFPPICTDGVLYWEIIDRRHLSIVSVSVFDLSTEKMSIIQSPIQYTHDIFGLAKHLTLLQGKLCCFNMIPSVDTILVMKIWRLNHYDFSGSHVDWVLMYRLDIYNSTRLLYPLYVDDRDRIICQNLGGLYRYDTKSKSLDIYPVSLKIEGVACYAHNDISVIHSEAIVPINPIRL